MIHSKTLTNSFMNKSIWEKSMNHSLKGLILNTYSFRNKQKWFVQTNYHSLTIHSVIHSGRNTSIWENQWVTHSNDSFKTDLVSNKISVYEIMNELFVQTNTSKTMIHSVTNLQHMGKKKKNQWVTQTIRSKQWFISE